MPLAQYDRWWGGKGGSATEAKRAMEKHYGAKKGSQIFYATTNKRIAQKKVGGIAGALRKHRK
jgi:hypothetical protein